MAAPCFINSASKEERLIDSIERQVVGNTRYCSVSRNILAAHLDRRISMSRQSVIALRRKLQLVTWTYRWNDFAFIRARYFRANIMKIKALGSILGSFLFVETFK